MVKYRHRRRLVVACGAFVVAMAMAGSPGVWAGDPPPCQEPWVDDCVDDTDDCTDCEEFCADEEKFPGQDCQVEFPFCEADDDCPRPWQKGLPPPYILEVCTCEPSGGGGSH